MQSYYYVGLLNEKKNVYFNHVQIFDYTIFNTNMRSALQLCKKTLNVQFLVIWVDIIYYFKVSNSGKRLNCKKNNLSKYTYDLLLKYFNNCYQYYFTFVLLQFIDVTKTIILRS